MIDRPYDPDDERTEYDDVPGPSAYDPAADDRAFGWEDDVVGTRSRRRGGRGDGPRFAAPTRRRRAPRVILGVALVLLLVGGVAGVWVQRQIAPAGKPGALQTVVIPKGASASSIGHLLSKDGIIGSSFVWDWYVRINGGGPFEAGEYQLATHSSMGDVVQALAVGAATRGSGGSRSPRATPSSRPSPGWPIPTKGLGLSLTKLQEALASGQVRSTYQPAGQTSREGILFPDTYEFDPKKTTELTVLQAMASQLDVTLQQLDVTAAETTPAPVAL